MTRPNGTLINDTNSGWNGITVFFAIQLGQALEKHADLLGAQTVKRWEKRYEIAIAFLYETIDSLTNNVNYPIGYATALALAGRYFDNDDYREKAKKHMDKIMDNQPNNMQIPQRVENICQTLRIESQEDGVYYRSVSDKFAVVETNLEDNRVLVSVRGILRNAEQKGTESFAISYVFEENRVKITAESSVQTGDFIFPIIASAMESVETVGENEKIIYRKQGQITLKSDGEIKMRRDEVPRLNPYARRFSDDKFDRTFHPVGGFETIMLYATLTKNKPIVLEIHV